MQLHHLGLLLRARRTRQNWIHGSRNQSFAPRSRSWSTTSVVDGDVLFRSMVPRCTRDPRQQADPSPKTTSRRATSPLSGLLQALVQNQREERTASRPERRCVHTHSGKTDWNIPHNFARGFSPPAALSSKQAAENGSPTFPSTVTGIARYRGFVLDSVVDPSSLRSNMAQIAQRFNNGESRLHPQHRGNRDADPL